MNKRILLIGVSVDLKKYREVCSIIQDLKRDVDAGKLIPEAQLGDLYFLANGVSEVGLSLHKESLLNYLYNKGWFDRKGKLDKEVALVVLSLLKMDKYGKIRILPESRRIE